MSKRVSHESELVDIISIVPSPKKSSNSSKKSVSKKVTKTKAKKKNKQLSKPIKQPIKQGVYGKFQSYKALCEALNITPANRYDRPKQKEQIEEYYLLQEKKGGRYETLPKQQIIDGH